MKKGFVLFVILLNLSQLMAQSKGNPDDRGYIVKLGDMAPDFTISYTDGSTKKLSDLRGSVVMLQFTASWCSVCRKEMPHIENEIWQPNKDKGLILIGIDRGETLEKTIEFVDLMKISYPLTLDLNDEIFTIYADKNAGVTRNIVIDKTGKIVFLTRLFEQNEFDAMKKLIESML